MSEKLLSFLNGNVSAYSAGRGMCRSGDLFGIELECEGKNVDYDGGDIKGWVPHDDGSLRKHHGSSCEWVFANPVNYKTSIALVDGLFGYFAKRKAKLVCSNRTSMHVHFNMGDKSNYQLVNLYIVFTILEGILDRYCGEERDGNLFCLSSRYASDQVTWVEEACFKYFNYGNFKEQNRYCSLNLASLNKFNSVEFRGMRGLDNKDDVLAWLSILSELTQFACYTMGSPVKVIEDISNLSPAGFLRTVFSPANLTRLAEGLSADDISASIYEGLRLIQPIAYKIGAVFDRVTLRKKDFWEEAGKDTVLKIPDDKAVGVNVADEARHDINNPFMRLPNPARERLRQDIARAHRVQLEAAQERPEPVDPLAAFAHRWADVPPPEPINARAFQGFNEPRIFPDVENGDQ